MAFFNEFPHTRTYDSDLAWLIRRMKEVLSRMDTLENRMKALEELVDNFIESLNIDEEIKKALRQMILDGAFNQIIEEMVEPYLGAFSSMKLTYEKSLGISDFSAIPSELTSLSSATLQIYENAVMAHIMVKSKWNPTSVSGLTFTSSEFFNVRISNDNDTIAKLKTIPIKDPDHASAIFQRQVGAFGMRNTYWTNRNFTSSKPCVSNLLLHPLGSYTSGSQFKSGSSMQVGGSSSLTFETYYIKDTP